MKAANRRYSIESLPIEHPPGENLFLAAVVIDTPDPCWDDGFTVIGEWEIVSATIASYINSDPRARKSTVSIYQGDAARKMFEHLFREEVRYEQHKRSQSNN
jgi:hypothetical protein